MAGLSNKELRKVVDGATSRGWKHERGSRRTCHTWLVHPNGHRVPIASSPSDRNAAQHVQRRIRQCDEGRCRCRGVKD